MLDQSFSSSNFNKLFLKENRKGNFDKSHFTQEYLDKHQEFKNTVGEKLNLKKTQTLTKEKLDEFAEKLEIINFSDLIRVIEAIKPEKNTIVSKFNDLKINTVNAFETQALLQLKNEYCNKQRCLDCEIGKELLGK